MVADIEENSLQFNQIKLLSVYVLGRSLLFASR